MTDAERALRDALQDATAVLLSIANGGLPGQASGDALDKVREHCREAGRAARTAYLDSAYSQGEGR